MSENTEEPRGKRYVSTSIQLLLDFGLTLGDLREFVAAGDELPNDTEVFLHGDPAGMTEGHTSIELIL